MLNFSSYILYLLLLTICYSTFGFTLDIKISMCYLTFTLLSLTSYTLYLLLLTICQFAFGFTLDIKLEKLYKAQCCPFRVFLKVVNFLLPSFSQFSFLLLGRKPVAWILHQLHKVPLPVSLVVHNILHGIGEYCKSVPLDHTGSYILSASI